MLRQIDKENTLNSFLKGCACAAGVMFLLWYWQAGSGPMRRLGLSGQQLPPLMMRGGDPYVRALMRTISAAESNVSQPYSVLYGGEYVADLSRHPDRCIRIVTGPNKNNCTTAAGRYQMLTTTWEEKARNYHPHPGGFFWWKSYSFEPEFQDAVVYGWLSDSYAWGADIPQLLRQGKLNEVLRLLSGTWTSLGYGIEDNSMTGDLPEVYQKMLREELRAAK
ncbi:glycoside hydrolase family 24 protein [Kamptonema formosum]|uniref:glycoside hydrolase family 24 protein n=1 Tax=Kamptonema formosum TaxID=331992 RepID=UPI000344CDDA